MHNSEHSPLSEKILNRIDKAGVRPIPKSYFSFRNVTLWVLAALSLVAGALSVSSIIFRIANLPAVLPPGATLALPIAVRLMPCVWILLLSVFGYLAYQEIRATRKGYRYEFSTILLTLLLASVVLGFGFYATGMGARLDRYAARHVPFVGKLDEEQRSRWMRPEHGFLIGQIVDMDATTLSVEDPNHVTWTVLLNEEIATSSVSKNMRVGVRGIIASTTEFIFKACDLRSLEFSGERKPPFPRLTHDEPERKPDSARTTECEGVRPPQESN